MKLSNLRLNENNPRTIKDDAFEKLCASISAFPKMMEYRPIIINDENIILGGNMRFRALLHLGFETVPNNWVKKASDLTPDEQSRFVIQDNISGGEWDWDALANEWELEDLENWGLDVPVVVEASPEKEKQSPAAIPEMTWPGVSVLMSDDEFAQLSVVYKQYLTDNGANAGFVGYLLAMKRAE